MVRRLPLAIGLAFALGAIGCPRELSPPTTQGSPSSRLPVASPATRTPFEPKLRVARTLNGTRTDVFTGELAHDPLRGLLLIGEQHDRPGGDVGFRVRVVNATTFRTIRRLGPGILRAIDVTRGTAYVEDVLRQDHLLYVFALDTGKLVRTLPVDVEPGVVAVDAYLARTYVARANRIDVYDAATFDLIDRFTVKDPIASIGVEKRSHRSLFVQVQGSVLTMDSRDGRIVRTYSTGNEAPLMSAGAGWFSLSSGDWRSSDLVVLTREGRRLWSTHFSRRVGRATADDDRNLLFHAVDDLTDSEFSPPNDRPDVVQVRSFSGGELLGELRVPDGPAVWQIDVVERRIYVSCLLANRILSIAY